MNQNKKEKLKILLDRLNAIQSNVAETDLSETTNSLIQAEIDDVTAKLKSNPTIKILQKFNEELVKFKKDFDIQPIMDAVTALQDEIKQEAEASQKTLRTEFESKLDAVKKSIPEIPPSFDPSSILKDIQTLRTQLDAKKDFDPKLLQDEMGIFKSTLDSLAEQFRIVVQNDIESDKEIKTKIEKEIDDLRIELLRRLAEKGGGNMNRQILVGGNASTLGKYTDINLKAGSNMVISYSNDNVNKRTDITFTSSGGGGGSVGGTVRSINNINTSQTAGNTSGTDYVYICSAGINLTLPTALVNTNQYTIKNISNSSVLVTTDGADTIDSDANIIMPIKYTSVDLISDQSANWNIT